MSSLWSVVLSSLVAGAAPPPPVAADFVLRGATLYDGGGGPGVVGDVAIAKDRIVAVGAFRVAGKPKVIDAKGLVVAPGFIDLHSHSDLPLQKKETRANQSFLYQGVTSVVTGNCGAGPADVAGYYKALDAGKVGTNVLHQVPHNSVRRQVMKNADRVPTAAELARMEALVAKGMKDGAWGLATGLIYTPGSYSKTDELVALAKVVAKHGGFYASHIRDEGTGVMTALEEAITIGQKAGLPVHISHLKASGPAVWGKSTDIVGRIAKARKDGLAMTADQYPYAASSTRLEAVVVPVRFRAGTRKEYEARLRDPEQGPAIRKAIEKSLEGRGGGKSLRIAYYEKRPDWRGKDVAAIAKALKVSPVDVVMEIERNGGAQIVSFCMSEEDVRLIMKQPFVATASDGSSMVPAMAKATVPHPRSYGTFPRKIGHYCLKDKVVALPQAIRSATGLPADVLKVPERGYLKKGYYADVVVFDPAKLRDLATYDEPHNYATGVRYLFVNGVLAISEGKYTGALAGKALRHAGLPAKTGD